MIILIDDIAGTSVWLVDENLDLITRDTIAGNDYSYADLPADAEKVVSEVFQGATTFNATASCQRFIGFVLTSEFGFRNRDE